MKEFKKKGVAIICSATMIIGTVILGGLEVDAASGDTVVYITKTGSCYHNSGCSSLSRSKIQTTLQEALNKGLTPCSKCHPVTGVDSDDEDSDETSDENTDEVVKPENSEDVTPEVITPEIVAVTGVSLNKKSASIQRGKTITLKATVKPSNADDKAVSWNSSNTKIAAVDKSGKVKGIKKGSATITVTTTDGKKTASCKVTVTEPVKSIKFSKKSYSVKKGKTVNLKYTITPKNASNKNVKFKSSDKKVATVDKNGKVKGVNKGKVIITVTTKDGNKTAKCTINVK